MDRFTNLYPLSKTLRFELKPEKETKERFEEWLRQINGNIENEENFLLKDKKIAAAYVALKTILDKIHEDFINISLASIAKSPIDFNSYLDAYKNKGEINEIESNLRLQIGISFSEGEKFFIEQFQKIYKEDTKYKSNNSAPYKCLIGKEILEYIRHNAKSFSSDLLSKDDIINHVNCFAQFYTYLQGFNQNRANYYTCNEEKATAIATRIVHENLPKFCDNIIRFENRKEEYLSIYEWLNSSETITQIKNAEKDVFENVIPICEDFFAVSHFNNCLTQQQIDEYNRIIGNFNLIVNLYNQAKRQEDKSFRKLDEFTTLFKQIGSDKKKNFATKLLADRECDLTPEMRKSEGILTAQSLIYALNAAGHKYFEANEDSKDTVVTFINFLKSCENWEGIYWSKSAINNISISYLSNWHSLIDRLKDKKACATYDKKREEPIQLREAIELSELFEALDEEKSEYVFKDKFISKNLIDLSKTPSENLIYLICTEMEENIMKFLHLSESVVQLEKYRQDIKDNSEAENDPIIQLIKEWFDYAHNVIKMVKFFAVRSSKIKGHPANTDVERMLNNILRNEDIDWWGWYDLMRNYLTQKPQDKAKDNKLKLNFGKPNLLEGFPDSNSKSDNGTQYGGYIFRKKHPVCDEYEYYLGISKKAKLFRCHLKDEVEICDRSDFERLDYYQMKSTTPYPNEYSSKKIVLQEIVKKLTIPQNSDEEKESRAINKSDAKGVTPTELIKRISKSNSFKWILENKEFLKEVDNIITLLIENCHSFIRVEALTKLNKSEYNGPEGLIKLIDDLSSITKKNKIFDYFHISKKEFDAHNGKDLFLFKISNKDLSYCETYAKGLRKEKTTQKENLHTLYFRALMHEEGYGDFVDIGKGSIYFREKSLFYDEKTIKHGHHVQELKDKFNYPIISNKRFSENKYLLHLSVFLNYKADTKDFNNAINCGIQEISDIHFIGVDRGEKHLVYTCQIDKNCNIIECKHYDVINGTNYVDKLDDIAKLRTKQLQNWQQKNSIKNLKEGYISHVVHRLTESIIKDASGNINPHAYIVLEDLNTEMKRSRQRFEKQVYQNLETALAKKLNFVVDKTAKEGELGHVSKALQLTPALKTYDDIRGKKQFGVMLYTRANYTSITDPSTGWRQTIYLKNGSDEEIKNQILERFTDIGFDGEDYFFEYVENNVCKTWRLYSGINGNSLPRFRNKQSLKDDQNIWVPEAIEVVPILDILFKDFDKNSSFKHQIENGQSLTKIPGRNETAWQTLRFVIGLIQQIRNSGNAIEDDNFLYSPVRDENGIHFDTRNAENNGPLSSIVDADANGAFNIARKGLIMDAHIKYANQNNIPMSDVDLYISDEEWDLWLLDRDKWNEKLPYYSLHSQKDKTASKAKGRKKK